MITLWIFFYLLPGLAGTYIAWNSFEMWGSKWIARIFMTLLWPVFLLILPFSDHE